MRKYSPDRESRKFRPALVPTLVTLVLLPLLAGLGFWQLQRADEKRALLDAFESGTVIQRLESPHAIRELPDLGRFQSIEMSGRYLTERQFLLDNMTEGGPGFHVLTPFLPTDGDEIVIVDRGWVPKTFGTGRLPDVTVPDGQRTISGRTSRLPQPGLRLGAASEDLTGWPRVVQFPTAGELGLLLEEEVMDTLVLLDDDQPDGYLRVWKPVEFGPERHVGYAVQWFALATTLLVIYGALNFRKGKP